MKNINDFKNMEELLIEFEARVVPLVQNNKLSNMQVNKNLLRRYLFAFKSLDLALERLMETNSWKEEFGVSKLSKDLPAIENNHATKVARILDKFDKEGRPILYVAVRNHVVYNRKIDEFTQYIVYLLEEACNQCKEELADNLCIIFDLQDMSLSCIDYSMVKTLVWLLNRHYPERLGVCFILNAPLLFSACWAIIQKWLDERTAKKVRFVSTLQQMESYVYLNSLPTNI